MDREIVKIEDINKKFGNHTVLNGVNLSIYKGEICSILGENGAGKSTLMKILSGVCSRDSGNIYFEGNKVEISNPRDAHVVGIRMIFQEPQLIDNFTVEQNIFVGNELIYKNTPFINRGLIYEKARDIFKILQYNVDVRGKVKELTYAQKKMVEIAKAIYFNAKVIIMDEPTSVFNDIEVQNLFHIIQNLKKMDVAIIYISHRIEEIIRISDRIVIMRDGKIVNVKTPGEKYSVLNLLEEMAGHDYINRYPKTKAPKGNVILEVRELSNKKQSVKNVSFSIRSGEIIGIAGLQGAGKSSLAKLIAGIEKIHSGRMFINGKEVKIKEPYQAVKYGIAYFSEDILKNIFMMQNVAYNVTISNIEKLSKYTFLKKQSIIDVTKDYIRRLNLKVMNPKESVKHLSGGTLQKLALSKWLFAGGKVYIMDEPSKGIDIASKVELYNLMNTLTKTGNSVLLISSDLRELIGMSDRIIILFNGSVVKEIVSSEANSVKILYYATGEKDLDS